MYNILILVYVFLIILHSYFILNQNLINIIITAINIGRWLDLGSITALLLLLLLWSSDSFWINACIILINVNYDPATT